MTWPPPIADELPAPRDDEPPELRRDIADELADHLACALNREIHRTADEASAKRNVIDRFGDPVQIARKLWFDSLKEKIMSQRIVVTAAVFLALAGFASTGMTWLIIRQTRDLNEQLLAESHNAAEQSRAANQALLDKLAELANRKPVEVAAPKSMEWNPVKVRLVAGEKGGPPAVGFTVRLQGYLLDTAKEILVDRTTGEDGIADFGLVRPGQHHFIITAPWGESMGMLPATAQALALTRGRSGSPGLGTSTTNRLTVLPGEAVLHEVICPPVPRKQTELALSVDWPDDFREQNLWCIGNMRLLPREFDEIGWSSEPDQEYQLFVIGPNQQLLDFAEPANSEVQGKSPPYREFLAKRMFESMGSNPMGTGNPSFPGFFQQSHRTNPTGRSSTITTYGLTLPKGSEQESIPGATGAYRIQNVGIFRSPSASNSEGLWTYPLVLGMGLANAPTVRDARDSSGSYVPWSIDFPRTPKFARSIGTAELPLLTANEGQRNAWTLSLPAAFVEKVRESLMMPVVEDGEKAASR